jgi:hypothetical protein
MRYLNTYSRACNSQTIKQTTMEKPHKEVQSMLERLQNRLDVLERKNKIESKCLPERNFSLDESALTITPGKKKLCEIYWDGSKYTVNYLADPKHYNLTSDTSGNIEGVLEIVDLFAAKFNKYI